MRASTTTASVGRPWKGLRPSPFWIADITSRGRCASTCPARYEDAIRILIESLTPVLSRTSDNGLAPFFYLPHVFFVANYGLDPEDNGGRDPFEVSMLAQYEITRRFSAEFSIRPFLDPVAGPHPGAPDGVDK